MKKIILTVCALAALSCTAFAKDKASKTPGEALDETITAIQNKTEEVKEKAKDKGADIKKKADKQTKKAKKNMKKAGNQMKKAANDIKEIFTEE